MPIYEYKCTGCEARHEFIQRFSDKPRTECPDCGGELAKLISSTSFVLKGTGWYVTDYATGERKKAMDAEKKKSSASGPEASDKGVKADKPKADKPEADKPKADKSKADKPKASAA